MESFHQSFVTLTVADGRGIDAALAEAEMLHAMQVHGPINAVCESVVLIEDSPGRWKELRSFNLAPSTASA
jgi:hypothetical protein